MARKERKPPPAARPKAPPARQGTIFSPLAIVGASLLGGLFAGAILLGINYRALGKVRASWIAFGAGAVAEAWFALFVIGNPLPDGSPIPDNLYQLIFAAFAPLAAASSMLANVGTALLFLIPSFAMLALTLRLQRRPFADHVRGGGKLYSGWNAFAAGLVCGILPLPALPNRHVMSPSAIPYQSAGQRASQAGQHDLAIALFSEALRIDEHSFATYAERAAAYLARREFDRALADCETALRFNASCPEAYVTRAAVLTQVGRAEEAVADCSFAMTLKPGSAFAHLVRSRGLLDLRQFDRAAADAAAALRLDPAMAE